MGAHACTKVTLPLFQLEALDTEGQRQLASELDARCAPSQSEYRITNMHSWLKQRLTKHGSKPPSGRSNRSSLLAARFSMSSSPPVWPLSFVSLSRPDPRGRDNEHCVPARLASRVKIILSTPGAEVNQVLRIFLNFEL